MVQPRKISAIVKQIIEHSDDIRTYELSPNRKIPAFKPGQFLHLAIDPYNPRLHWPESRIFSIVSSPAVDNKLIITISKKGYYTKRIFTELKKGDEIWVKMPYGDFIIDPKPDDVEIILIAGGTGITPFIPFIESLVSKNYQSEMKPIKLFYGTRSSKLLIYKSNLEIWRKLVPNLALFYSIESPLFSDNFDFEEGILSIDRILSNVNNISKAKFYISGPPAMLFAFRKELKGCGVTPERIKIDAWE